MRVYVIISPKEYLGFIDIKERLFQNQLNEAKCRQVFMKGAGNIKCSNINQYLPEYSNIFGSKQPNVQRKQVPELGDQKPWWWNRS